MACRSRPRGSALLASRRTEDLRAARDLFASAAAEDPNDTTALTGLAESHSLLGLHGLEDHADAASRTVRAASRAIELDPGFARPYRLRASVALDTQWNLTASARDFRRALALDPGDPLAQ